MYVNALVLKKKDIPSNYVTLAQEEMIPYDQI